MSNLKIAVHLKQGPLFEYSNQADNKLTIVTGSRTIAIDVRSGCRFDADSRSAALSVEAVLNCTSALNGSSALNQIGNDRSWTRLQLIRSADEFRRRFRLAVGTVFAVCICQRHQFSR